MGRRSIGKRALVISGICLSVCLVIVFLRVRPASLPVITPVASFPQVDPPEARIRRAEAIQIAQEAFRKAKLSYEGLKVDARYVMVEEKNGSKHQEWWVFFFDPKVTGIGAPGVYIDDRTGKSHVVLVVLGA